MDDAEKQHLNQRKNPFNPRHPCSIKTNLS